MHVIIAGGGTGGHLFPGIAIGEELIARGHEVTFVGTERGAYQGGTFPSPLARQSRASLPPPREGRASLRAEQRT